MRVVPSQRSLGQRKACAAKETLLKIQQLHVPFHQSPTAAPLRVEESVAQVAEPLRDLSSPFFNAAVAAESR